MKKTELKVGTDYAVSLQPIRGNYRRYRHGELRRATLVSLGDTVEREPYIEVYSNGRTAEKSRDERGIVVKLAEPFKREVPKYRPGGGYYWSNASPKTRRLANSKKKIVETVETVALESGACFYSTWDDLVEEQRREKEWKEKRARETAERIAREKAEGNEHAARIEQVRELLRSSFGHEHDWGAAWKEQADEFEYGVTGSRAKLKLNWSRDSQTFTGGRVSMDIEDFLALIAGEPVRVEEDEDDDDA